MQVHPADDALRVHQDQAVALGVEDALDSFPAVGVEGAGPVEVESVVDLAGGFLVLFECPSLVALVDAEEEDFQSLLSVFFLDPLDQGEFLDAAVSGDAPDVDEESLASVGSLGDSLAVFRAVGEGGALVAHQGTAQGLSGSLELYLASVGGDGNHFPHLVAETDREVGEPSLGFN